MLRSNLPFLAVNSFLDTFSTAIRQLPQWQQPASHAETWSVSKAENDIKVKVFCNGVSLELNTPVSPTPDSNISLKWSAPGESGSTIVKVKDLESSNDSAIFAKDSPFHELFKAIKKKISYFTKTNLPDSVTTAEDSSIKHEVPEYSTFILKREGAPDLQFSGKLIGAASSSMMSGLRGYALRVYKTPKDKYVAVKIGFSMVPGESQRTEHVVVDSLDKVKEFFGYSAVAKALYGQLGINAIEVLE